MSTLLSPTSPRPLLRFPSPDASPQEIAAHEFGGVVLEASTAAPDFILSCRAQNLEVWLDISDFSAGKRDDLQRWNLEFDEAHPRLARSASGLLDPFHTGSIDFILETLSGFQPGAITGVLCAWNWENDGRALPSFPWSKALESKFDAATLPALVSNTGDDAARARQEFWRALSDLSAANLTRLQQWCAAQNIQFIAWSFAPEREALQLSEVLRARLKPDYPPLLKGDCPATVLREAYRFFHAGATRFQVEYSPRVFSTGAKLLNQSIARSAQRMIGSHNAARVGVLFPARSCQTHYHPDGHRFTRWAGDDLERITALLDNLHFDWIFINEEQLCSARLESTTLQIGAHECEMIVAPSITALSTRAWQMLENFVESGGKVACLGLLPRWNESGRDRVLETRAGKAALLSVEDLYDAYAALENGEPLPPTLGFPVFREHESGGRLCSYQPRLNEDTDDARLRVHQILHESLASDLETQSAGVLYSHRIADENETFFIFNNSEETQHVNARLRPELNSFKNVGIQAFDAATGDQKMLRVWMPHPLEQGGGLSVSLDLASGEARFVSLETQNAKPETARIERATFEIEYCDEKVARGFATQSGAQRLAIRDAKKLQWRQSETLNVPAPILIYEAWQSARDGENIAFETSIDVPAAWETHRVFLDVAFASCVIELCVNGQDLPPRIAPPLRFEVTSTLRFGQSNRFIARCECGSCDDDDDENFLARLAAYPVVEISME